MLSTQEAADLVGVSRPYIVARIEAGAAAFAALRATLRSAPTPEALLDRLAAHGHTQTATARRVAMQRRAVQL